MRVKYQHILVHHPRRELFMTKTKTEAKYKAWWAEIIIDHQGGYLAFEKVEDYRKWAVIDAIMTEIEGV